VNPDAIATVPLPVLDEPLPMRTFPLLAVSLASPDVRVRDPLFKYSLPPEFTEISPPLPANA
jgi:hypothetical protein